MPESENLKHEVDILRLRSSDICEMRKLLDLFGAVFGEKETYSENQPSDNYLIELLSHDHFVALIAQRHGKIVGGLAAYELTKFEQERSEFYIYDLAVDQPHRRRGIATALIEKLAEIAAVRKAYVVFVQADRGDEPAIALYEKLGVREEVLHFDIQVRS